jgi:hypothetical protein
VLAGKVSCVDCHDVHAGDAVRGGGRPWRKRPIPASGATRRRQDPSSMRTAPSGRKAARPAITPTARSMTRCLWRATETCASAAIWRS